jgi:soluble lytic murein transglycosylase-like protein
LGRRTIFSGTILGGLALAAPSAAELAIFADGDFVKIARYELLGERMQLHLSGGGSLTLPLERLERIVDDEVELPASQPAEEPEPASPSFEMSFLPAHRVPASPYGEVLYAAAKRHALNPELLAAVARAESSFDPSALSPKGARGILQLMPATAERFGIQSSRLWDPESNVEAGARFLRFLVDEFRGDLRLVLAAYNAGEGAVRRHGGVPPYRETRQYVERILGTLGVSAPPPAIAASRAL